MAITKSDCLAGQHYSTSQLQKECPLGHTPGELDEFPVGVSRAALVEFIDSREDRF